MDQHSLCTWFKNLSWEALQVRAKWLLYLVQALWFLLIRVLILSWTPSSMISLSPPQCTHFHITIIMLLLLLLSLFSRVRLCVTPETAAHLSLGFSRQEHWSGLPFPSSMRESEVAQSCLTLSHPMDCSPPGSSIHGIFQARVLEWGAIAFSGRTMSHPLITF